MLTDEFFNFCTTHCCHETYKNRSDYCPIADEVRMKWGTIHGGIECQSVFLQQNIKSNNIRSSEKRTIIEQSLLGGRDIKPTQ